MRILLVVFGSSWGDLNNVEHALETGKIEFRVMYARHFTWPKAEDYDIIVQLGLSETEDQGVSFLLRLCEVYPVSKILLATQHLSATVEKKVREAAPGVEFLRRQVGNGFLIVQKLREMMKNKTAP